MTKVEVTAQKGYNGPSRLLTFTPSDVLTQQSFIFHLRPDYDLLSIGVTKATSLRSRPHRVVVTARMQRVQQLAGPNPNLAQFRVLLVPGLNHIMVDLIAIVSQGPSEVGVGQEIELERVTLLVNLQKRVPQAYPSPTQTEPGDFPANPALRPY